MTDAAPPAPNSPVSPPQTNAEAPDGAATKPFTAKQQQVWDLTRPLGEGGQGKTRAEAAAILGISTPVVSKTLQACYRKRGIKHKKGELSVSTAVELKDPERFAAIVDAGTEPEAKLESIAKVFRDYGLPPIASAALLRRIRNKYFGVVEATRSLKSGEIVDALNHKIDLALRYMDDKTMSEASFRDLALGTTAMIEKRQLLRGEPTQIVSDHERKKIHELVPALLAEAQRRGLTVEGQVMERKVEPLGSAA